jgi:hypothetical protein
MACQVEQKRNVEAYYLPLKALKEGLVYEYQSTNPDTFPPYYWYYRTIEQGRSTFLTGMYYDYKFMPQQLIRQLKVANGILLEEAFIYETDSNGYQIQIPMEINNGNSFPFEVKDSLGVFLYRVSWQSALDTSKISVIRNRRFISITTYDFQGKSYPAIEFSVRELVEHDKEGVLTIELIGREIYAKGIGLVYVEKRALQGNYRQVYYLSNRYEMSVLEQKFTLSNSG